MLIVYSYTDGFIMFHPTEMVNSFDHYICLHCAKTYSSQDIFF